MQSEQPRLDIPPGSPGQIVEVRQHPPEGHRGGYEDVLTRERLQLLTKTSNLGFKR
jgi:hypothetical protein